MKADLAPKVGIAACLATVAAIVAPYFIAPASAVSVYYAQPIPVPVHLLGGLFALVGVIVFASGMQRRTDPQTAAGAAVVLGLFVSALTLWWAVSVPADLIGSLTTASELQYHRWLLAVVALAVTASAAWYARDVL